MHKLTSTRRASGLEEGRQRCMSKRVPEKVKTRVQVCALQWSRHEKEILSSHGFSQNQLCLWKYPSMAKV